MNAKSLLRLLGTHTIGTQTRNKLRLFLSSSILSYFIGTIGDKAIGLF